MLYMCIHPIHVLERKSILVSKDDAIYILREAGVTYCAELIRVVGYAEIWYPGNTMTSS